MKCTNYEAPHFAIFPAFHHFTGCYTETNFWGQFCLEYSVLIYHILFFIWSLSARRFLPNPPVMKVLINIVINPAIKFKGLCNTTIWVIVLSRTYIIVTYVQHCSKLVSVWSSWKEYFINLIILNNYSGILEYVSVYPKTSFLWQSQA